jgi:hypothetical protein
MKKSAKISAPILQLEQLIDSKEVMRITGWSRKTLFNYTHVYRGRPPLLSYIRLRGRQKFRPQLVEYFLQQNAVKGVYHVEKDLT